MALLLKTPIVADEASHKIQRTDLTGVYNATTNPGGRGAAQIPAGTREVADINSGNLYIVPFSCAGTIVANGGTSLTVSELLYSKVYSAPEAQAFTTTPEILDLGALVGDTYVDGVYFGSYTEWYVGTGLVSNVTLSKVITVTDYNIFTNAKYIAIDVLGDAVYKLYEIVKVNADNTIEINIELLLNPGRAYKVGYESINYFANVFDINKCLHSSIAKTACSDCKCNEAKVEKHFTAVMQFFGIQTNMDRGNYKCSQELIDAITIYCSKHGCGCGC